MLSTATLTKGQENESLQGVEDTLFTTLFAKARDAESLSPILADAYARPLLDRCHVDLSSPTFRGIDNPAGIQGVATRAKIIDGWVCDFLVRHQGQPVTVIHLGCGMDCRAMRVNRNSNVRWIDVDFPAVVELRRRVVDPPLAGDYQLLGCDASDGRWLEQVPADRPTLVVAEGVLLYWAPGDAETLIRKIVERFGLGALIFDTTSSVYVRLSQHVAVLQANGSRWRWGIEHSKAVESLHPALQFVREVNLPGPEALAMTLKHMFGEQFNQLKHELEISSGVYKPISRILHCEFRG